MRFRNTINLFVENFKNVFKILLFKLIIGLVAGALLCALVLPEVYHIGESAQWIALSEDVKEFFFMLNPGHAGSFEVAAKAILNDSLPAFGAFLLSRAGEIVWISVGCLAIFLVARFAETVCLFALGDTLDDKMQTYGNMTFGSSFVKNFGRASRYAFWYAPYTLLFDLATFVLCYVCLSFINVLLGLFLSVIIIAVMQSIKLTVACFWMPAMTADRKSLKEALKTNSLMKGQFWKTFSVYLVLVYLIFVLNALSVTCTFGSGLILTIPASFALLLTFQYVNYYTILGRKYFITYDTITHDKDRGNSERFFERLQEEEAATAVQQEEPKVETTPAVGTENQEN